MISFLHDLVVGFVTSSLTFLVFYLPIPLLLLAVMFSAMGSFEAVQSVIWHLYQKKIPEFDPKDAWPLWQSAAILAFSAVLLLSLALFHQPFEFLMWWVGQNPWEQ